MIGLVTAVIGDVAGHLGCFIFLKDSVNAIAFVALGTSVPGKVYFIQTKNTASASFEVFCSHKTLTLILYYGRIHLPLNKTLTEP